MRFLPSRLGGAFLVELEPARDDRGFFMRTFCADEFRRHGLDPAVAQCGLSRNVQKGTLRGLHYQAAPKEEAKLVRCTRGRIFDVIVDLRPDSKTRFEWESFELSEDAPKALFVPKGFAHGFETLEDDTDVYYQISEFHAPESARGIRWDDPRLAISWPEKPRVISGKDAALPFLK